MEKEKTLLERDGRYDSKHILNTCTKPVPQTILDAIERGCTIEALERAAKDFDIFKYKTQITIHGLFPQLSTNYIGEYKNLVRNKNLSVGIRYSAIDCEKRHRMASKMNYFGWHYKESSSDNCFYIEKMTGKIEEHAENLRVLTLKLKSLNMDNFNGSARIIQGELWGMLISLLKVNVNSIYEKDMDAAIANLCGCEDMQQVNDKIAEIKRQEAERRAKEEEERRIQQEKNNALFEAYFRENPLPEEYILKEGYQLKEGDIILKVSRYINDGKPAPELKYYKIFKSYGSLVARRCDRAGENVEKHGTKLQKVIGKWRVKSAPEQVKVVKQSSKVAPKANNSEKVVRGAYNIVDYSERAIAVTGDTKAIKETLKGLGGRFNPRLTCGPGWIFSKSKESALRAAIC